MFDRLLACLMLLVSVGCADTPPCADEDCGPEDAASRDAASDVSRDVRDAVPDTSDASATADADVTPPDLTCSDSDVEAWRRAHRRLDLVDRLTQCAINTVCDGLPCSYEQCLRARAGVEACEECTSREIACILTNCRDQCGTSGSSEHCRYCLCETGCAQTFSDCAGQTLNACRPCDSTNQTCAPYELPTEVIMTIVGCRPNLATPVRHSGRALPGGSRVADYSPLATSA